MLTQVGWEVSVYLKHGNLINLAGVIQDAKFKRRDALADLAKAATGRSS